MKAFFIILTICVIMVSGIIYNSIYVQNFATDAQEQLSSISFDDKDLPQRLSSFTSFTEKMLKKVEFAIPHTKTELAEDYLDLLNLHASSEERSEFEKTRVLLMNLFKEIGDLQKTDLSNIL